MKQVETKNDFQSLLLSNLLAVPSAAGGVDFSMQGSNMRHGTKKLTDVAKNVLKRLFVDNCGDLGWGQRAVETKEVCGETSNVRSSHGSSRDHVGPPIIPSGNDVQAGSEDVNGGTKIGEVSPFIIDIRSGDSDCLLNAGRRVVARVVVIVSSGHGDRDTMFVKLRMESLVSDVTVNSVHLEHTVTTALSRASEGPPPKLIEATEGLPVLLASSATQSTPAIL